MDGAGTGADVAHDAQGRFVSGHSEYAARKRRIAERLAQLVADYNPSPSQKQLLVVVAGHLDDAERCRSAIARTRATNAARRLLKDIPRKPGSPAPRLPAAADQAAQALELLLNSKKPSDGHTEHVGYINWLSSYQLSFRALAMTSPVRVREMQSFLVGMSASQPSPSA